MSSVSFITPAAAKRAQDAETEPGAGGNGDAEGDADGEEEGDVVSEALLVLVTAASADYYPQLMNLVEREREGEGGREGGREKERERERERER